jgi:hypothetical protein
MPLEQRLTLQRDVLELLAQKPDVIQRAQKDPVFCINTFFWGIDREKRPPRVFKAQLWDWQVDYSNYLAHLADLDGGSFEEDEIALIILKTRGCGATWTSLWFITWAMWTMPWTQALVQSDTEKKSQDMMQRHTDTINMLPGSFPYPGVMPGGRDNLSSRDYDNHSEIHSLSGDPEGIRSYHPSIVVIDEAAKIRSSVVPALLGLSCDKIVLSTADGYGNPSEFDVMWHDAKDNAGATYGYRPLFLSWRERPNLAERPSSDPTTQAQEYPENEEEAFRATGSPYFDMASMEESAKRHTKQPAEILDQGHLKVWEKDDGQSVYVHGIDTAKGREVVAEQPGLGDIERGGRDFSVITVHEWVSGRQVACWHGRIQEHQLAHKAYLLLQRYPGMLVVERPGPGEAVADKLTEMCPHRLYYDPVDRFPGILLTVGNRPRILALMAQTMLTYELNMRDRSFWSECRFFGIQKNSRVEANPGYHDDRIMSAAIAHWVRTHMAPPPRHFRRARPLRDYRAPFDRPVAERMALRTGGVPTVSRPRRAG